MNRLRLVRGLSVAVVACTLAWGVAIPPSGVSGQGEVDAGATSDDLLFIHHSCGSNWLDSGLDSALVAKSYIDERNDITYSTDVSPDAGRPDSLGGTPGDKTDMNHWVYWFNDYFGRIRSHGAASGYNRIVMFKSCYPNSDVEADGTEPGDPFSGTKTITNYKAIYRHPSGSGNSYTNGGYTYKPLEDIFAEHPDVLFIPVTAPPLNYSGTSDAKAHRARLFNNWLKNDWLTAYNAAHPGLYNVAVFDWFDVLAYPDNHATHPNRLKAEYGGSTGDAHPNATANAYSTTVFATDEDNFIDDAWDAFINGGPATPTAFHPGIHASPPAAEQSALVTFSVVITGPLTGAAMTNTVPAGLAYQVHSLGATAGSTNESGRPTLRWTGNVDTGDAVTVTYQTLVSTADRSAITCDVQLSATDSPSVAWQTRFIANGLYTFCPVVLKLASS